jgi:predicted porin
MQKKIIALAITAAISSSAFAADTSSVTVYGLADVSFDSINTGTPTTTGTAATTGVRSNRVASNSSRLGFKGSEDLGNGLSAIFQIESQIDFGYTNANNTNNRLGSRDTFVGLSSAEAGTVLLGRHDTPYKMATRAYDVFADGIADNRSIMGGRSSTITAGVVTTTSTGGFVTSVGLTAATVTVPGSTAASFDDRQNQVLAYVTPKIGGMFTGVIGYVNLNPAYQTQSNNKATATSVAGLFDIGGGLSGSLAYEVHNLNAIAAPLVSGSKESATKLGVGYAQDMFAVNFVYEKTKDNFGAAGSDTFGHHDYYLSGKFNLTSSDTIKAAYTKAGNLNMGGVAAFSANTGAKQFSLGYDHNLSKRTTVYALYTKLSNDSQSGYALSGASDVGGATTSAGVGASPSAFALGMRHSF